MTPPRIAELGEAFTVHEARAAGITSWQLRSGALEQPFHGVRLRPHMAADDDRHTASDAPYDAIRHEVIRRAAAYREIMRPGHFFVSDTAALLYGLPIDHGHDLMVAAPRPARAPRGRGIHGIQISPELVRVREHRGFRVSSPASTWATLGAARSVRDLVRVGDALVHVPRDDWGRPHPEVALATIAELHAAVTAGRRVGVVALREAVELVRVGSASPLETDFRLDAASAGLPTPELDVEIFAADGRRIGITEFVFREYRTVVEVEGDHHRTSRAQWNRDIEKYAAYAASGWEVVRLTSAHIRAPHARATQIVRDVLARRGWRG
ncbi:hypothetical protein [Microbacterium sp. C7(2022)]|uniref:hypothetical protein n=1 Tax=Microbacterium sp. C7(2022) TaxID=2992759 RepID=UPI00237BF977|nr:hypothetical protein [Microbacterium sp. C7(2022)]MDE0546230.1 hypothetical protein [Microbacterium sp. C7(2022)]